MRADAAVNFDAAPQSLDAVSFSREDTIGHSFS
jgi:hypothetical protein